MANTLSARPCALLSEFIKLRHICYIPYPCGSNIFEKLSLLFITLKPYFIFHWSDTKQNTGI